MYIRIDKVVFRDIFTLNRIRNLCSSWYRGIRKSQRLYSTFM